MRVGVPSGNRDCIEPIRLGPQQLWAESCTDKLFSNKDLYSVLQKMLLVVCSDFSFFHKVGNHEIT